MPALEDVLSSGAYGTPLTPTNLINRVRHLLEDEPWQDSLTAAYTAGAGQVTLGYPTKWAEGSLIEPDDATGSLLRVSVTPTVNPVTVQASWNGTVDVNHAINTVVFKNPRFPMITILDALSAVIASRLPPGVYLTKTTSFTTPGKTSPYIFPLPNDFDGLVGSGIVQQSTSSIVGVDYYDWHTVEGPLYNLPTSISPSTVGLRFRSLFNYTNPVYVNYRAQPTLTTIPDGDIAELIVNLACARILGAKEVPLGGASLKRTAANDIVQKGGIRQDAAWFRLQAMEIAAQIRASLSTEEPRAKRYVRG